jgi:hypothetical protein
MHTLKNLFILFVLSFVLTFTIGSAVYLGLKLIFTLFGEV